MNLHLQQELPHSDSKSVKMRSYMYRGKLLASVYCTVVITISCSGQLLTIVPCSMVALMQRAIPYQCALEYSTVHGKKGKSLPVCSVALSSCLDLVQSQLSHEMAGQT